VCVCMRVCVCVIYIQCMYANMQPVFIYKHPYYGYVGCGADGAIFSRADGGGPVRSYRGLQRLTSAWLDDAGDDVTQSH